MNKKDLIIRNFVADLYCSAGCSCCRSDDEWYEAAEKLAKLLKIPMFNDKSGFDFWKFRTKSVGREKHIED